MIQFKKGDKVYHKDGFKDIVFTVIALDNDNLHMSIQNSLIKNAKILSPVLITAQKDTLLGWKTLFTIQ